MLKSKLLSVSLQTNMNQVSGIIMVYLKLSHHNSVQVCYTVCQHTVLHCLAVELHQLIDQSATTTAIDLLI